MGADKFQDYGDRQIELVALIDNRIEMANGMRDNLESLSRMSDSELRIHNLSSVHVSDPVYMKLEEAKEFCLNRTWLESQKGEYVCSELYDGVLSLQADIELRKMSESKYNHLLQQSPEVIAKELLAPLLRELDEVPF
jgi:hypothetical protein